MRLSRPRRRESDAGSTQDSPGFQLPKLRFPAFAAVIGSDNNPLKDFKPPALPHFDLPFVLTWAVKEVDGHPNKQRLLTVSGFFDYTEQQDKEMFKRLDRDGDGRVQASDLKEYLRRKNLPEDYAHEFINRARGPRWWSSSITYDEFKSLIDDNESKMLRAFCMLDVDGNGFLDVNKIKASLAKLQLPATDANAKAMLRTVGAAEDASVAYGEFRRFVMMLPGDKLASEAAPNVMWFESATLVPIGPLPENVGGKGTAQILIRAALAGGLSSGCSTLCMHPLDTLKTRVQSIPGATIGSVVRSVPQLGTRALYRGFIPAVGGSFSSHGIRTCSYEACLLALGALGVPYMQAQPVASFVGTFVGTVFRIPCEVLKQQLQAGRHENVRVAFSELRRLDGTRGFFRGAGALLSREVPFYVFGMILYEQYKRLATGEFAGLRPRKLSNVECIALGALAGASGSLLTTPADVLKSRLMTAAAGSNLTARQVLVDLLQKEGFAALFKGALPRAVWIAPLGAMNFAGYELAKRALAAGDGSAGDGAAPAPPGASQDPPAGPLVAASSPLSPPAAAAPRAPSAPQPSARVRALRPVQAFFARHLGAVWRLRAAIAQRLHRLQDAVRAGARQPQLAGISFPRLPPAGLGQSLALVERSPGGHALDSGAAPPQACAVTGTVEAACDSDAICQGHAPGFAASLPTLPPALPPGLQLPWQRTASQRPTADGDVGPPSPPPPPPLQPSDASPSAALDDASPASGRLSQDEPRRAWTGASGAVAVPQSDRAAAPSEFSTSPPARVATGATAFSATKALRWRFPHLGGLASTASALLRAACAVFRPLQSLSRADKAASNGLAAGVVAAAQPQAEGADFTAGCVDTVPETSIDFACDDTPLSHPIAHVAHEPEAAAVDRCNPQTGADPEGGYLVLADLDACAAPIEACASAEPLSSDECAPANCDPPASEAAWKLPGPAWEWESPISWEWEWPVLRHLSKVV